MNRSNVVSTRIIVIGSFTLMTIFAWVGIEVYSRLTTDRVSPQLEKQITELNPRLNLQILDQLANKRYLPITLTRSNENSSE